MGHYHRTKSGPDGKIRHAHKLTMSTQPSVIEFVEGVSDITLFNIKECELILPDSVMALSAPRQGITRLRIPALAYSFKLPSTVEITNPEVIHKQFISAKTENWWPHIEFVAEGSDNSIIELGCHLCANSDKSGHDPNHVHICALSHPVDPQDMSSTLFTVKFA